MEKRRLYSWSLITYGTEEEIKRICNEAQHYAYIYHGAEEGKEPHYHILATFKTWKSLTSLKVILNNGQNILGQKLIDKLAAYRYLTHKDNPEKVQYNDEDIRSDNKTFWGEEEKEDTIQMLEDIINKVSYRDMARKYGKDFIKNFESYRYYAELMKFEEDRAAAQIFEETPTETLTPTQIDFSDFNDTAD